MREINDQQYSKFTPAERVQLTFAALARNDEVEANRLWETCPQYTFKTHDLNYTERFNAVILLGTVFFERCVRHYNLIKKADEYIESANCDLESEEDAGLTEVIEQTKKIIGLAEEARKINLMRLKALYKGFEQFCSEIGVSYGDLCKTLPIEGTCLDIGFLLATEGVAGSEDIKEVYEMFLSYWKF